MSRQSPAALPERKHHVSELRAILIRQIEFKRTSYKLLSRKSGINKNTIERFANGKQTITLASAEKLCDALGLELTFKPFPLTSYLYSRPDVSHQSSAELPDE